MTNLAVGLDTFNLLYSHNWKLYLLQILIRMSHILNLPSLYKHHEKVDICDLGTIWYENLLYYFSTGYWCKDHIWFLRLFNHNHVRGNKCSRCRGVGEGLPEKLGGGVPPAQKPLPYLGPESTIFHTLFIMAWKSSHLRYKGHLHTCYGVKQK